MNLVKIEMPSVSECSATDCAYNVNQLCHARAITIGNGVHPGCDTFFAHEHIQNVSQIAGVGACKVDTCKYNEDCECMGDLVRVGPVEGGAICVSYTAW